jgi:hypothetical protein
LCNRTAERIGVYVIDETAPSVDLDDRDPLPVGRLERGIPVDGNLAQLEAELLVRGADDAAGSRAEMAAGGRVQNDLGYG